MKHCVRKEDDEMMRKNQMPELKKFAADHRRKRRFNRILTTLGGVVVFCTTYALILPAITMERYGCQLPQHTHDDSCYTQITERTVYEMLCDPAGHVHTDACRDEAGNLVCGYADFVLHTHDQQCYAEDGTLMCTLPEIQEHTHGEECYEVTVHSHTDDCYRQIRGELTCEIPEFEGHAHDETCTGTVLICQEQEYPGHTHNGACFETKTCELEESEEHTHDETCSYTTTICQEKEGSGHAHGEECYETMVCELPESEGHAHTDDCYTMIPEQICGMEEGQELRTLVCSRTEYALHTHDETCYDENGACICGKLQLLAHQHTEDCFRQHTEPVDTENLTCQDENHEHTPRCYGTWERTCGMEEHTHTEQCKGENPISRDFTYEDEYIRMVVNVRTPEPLPEDVTLQVTEMDPEQYEQLLATREDPESLEFWILRDVQLVQDGQVLDTILFDMTAEVTLQEQILEPMNTMLLEEGYASEALAVEMAAWQLGQEEGLTPLNTNLFSLESTPSLHVSVTSGTIAILGGATANPNYQVQYYGEILTAGEAKDGDLSVPVIYTSTGTVTGQNGKPVLPKNGEELTIFNMPLRNTGKTDNTVNNGMASALYQVDSSPKLTKLYYQKDYTYLDSPNVAHVDILAESTGYELSEIWVSKDGKTGLDDTESTYWDVYTDVSDVHFTSRAEFARTDTAPYRIYVTENTVLRLVYKMKDNNGLTVTGKFFDYDITNGEKATVVSEKGSSSTGYRTDMQGINSYARAKNYLQNNRLTASNLLSFGNQNTGTGLDKSRISGTNNYLNKTNGVNTNYGGLCFEIVTGLTDWESGSPKLVYNEGVTAPDLFLENENVTGKTNYNGTLTFLRNGDNYTLTSVNVTNAGSAKNLNLFTNPSPDKNTAYDGVNNKNKKTIYTNNFWPMDSVTGAKDPQFGEDGTTVNYAGLTRYKDGDNGVIQDYTNHDVPSAPDVVAAFPASDDGKAHNSYFGMQFRVTFQLTADYCGPLNYLFFGDDDMWVFLDGKLICDIGGVHSSYGEYVDLWNYLDIETDEDEHVLDFFYTERGASGSTCYMSFTLPSVTGASINYLSSQLEVKKTVTSDVQADKEREYTFRIQFTDSNGSTVNDDYSYDKYDSNGNVQQKGLMFFEGSTFTLKDGEYMIVPYLPTGLNYTIEELDTDGFTVTNTVNGVTSENGASASGKIEEAGKTYQVVFTNTSSRVSLQVQKQNQKGENLAGAQFQLKSGGNALYLMGSAGNYTLPSSITELLSTGGTYYLTDGMNYVNLSGGNVSMGSKDSAAKLTFVAAGDGSYELKAADGSYLYLTDTGTMGVGANPSNRYWYFTVNSDGTLKITPRSKVIAKVNGAMSVQETGIAFSNSGTTRWNLVADGTTVNTSTLECDAQGHITISGLTKGIYTLVETKAPENYKVADPVTIYLNGGNTISIDQHPDATAIGNTVTLTDRYVDKKVTLKKLLELYDGAQSTDNTTKFQFKVQYLPEGETDASKMITMDAIELASGETKVLDIPLYSKVFISEVNSDGYTLSFLIDDTKQTLNENGELVIDRLENDIAVTAVNRAGYTLPETGGRGTQRFLLLGSILTIAALWGIEHIIRKKERGFASK